MLMNLQVRDFAIVDRIDIEFAPGMTVLTGETGAGKSILVDALGLVLGERGSAQLVRDGAKRAEFAAEFDVGETPGRQAHGWTSRRWTMDDDCLLRRVINADGRSRAFVNGNAVPLSQLKALGELLLDIHGQHFHQSLGPARIQRDLLDHFGGLLDDRAEAATHYIEWQVPGRPAAGTQRCRSRSRLATRPADIPAAGARCACPRGRRGGRCADKRTAETAEQRQTRGRRQRCA